MLFHGRGGMAMAELLDVGGDVDRTHGSNRRYTVSFQPSAERSDRPDVGSAGVQVADLGGEELQKAIGGPLTCCSNQGWSVVVHRRGELALLLVPPTPVNSVSDRARSFSHSSL